MDTHSGQAESDPWQVLGVQDDATDEQIRAAYIEKVKLHPPDRDQRQFERIRDAYEVLRDPRRRAERMVFSADPNQPLPALLEGLPPRRRHLGPQPWLAALKQR
jgi:curved DNA-binding protein CbpA